MGGWVGGWSKLQLDHALTPGLQCMEGPASSTEWQGAMKAGLGSDGDVNSAILTRSSSEVSAV